MQILGKINKLEMLYWFVILKWTWKEYNANVYVVFCWLRKDFKGRLLCDNKGWLYPGRNISDKLLKDKLLE
jgi:hypothetical protein